MGLAAALRRTGAKGERNYDWAWITLTPDGTDTGCWWLLVRRNQITGELAFYRCYAPQIVPLRELVRVAGRRWTIEESFQTGKGLAGLDEHQVRRWTSWRRWTLLAMIAHALLVVIAANEHTDWPAAVGIPPLSCSEIRRLFTGPCRVTPPRAGLSIRLVELAPTPPTPRPHQPLQTSANSPTTAITIYGWSISRPRSTTVKVLQATKLRMLNPPASFRTPVRRAGPRSI